jgi:hypothetical protein
MLKEYFPAVAVTSARTGREPGTSRQISSRHFSRRGARETFSAGEVFSTSVSTFNSEDSLIALLVASVQTAVSSRASILTLLRGCMLRGCVIVVIIVIIAT